MKAKFVFPCLIVFLFGLVTIRVLAQHPSIGGYSVYYGSLHNHTGFSDGNGTPAQAYAYARDVAKLDFFGLSEHSDMMVDNEWINIKAEANAANQVDVFAAFYGFEWTSIFHYGHVSVFNTEDYCTTYNPTGTFSSLLTWINARNGIAFFNHPGWDILAFDEFHKFQDTPSEKFVGMELWNDMDGFSKYYYNSGLFSGDGKGYFDEALVRGWNIGAAGGDDNHDADWGTATNFRMGVLAGSLSRDEILKAFIARRFFSTLDKNIAMSFRINGSEMGSTVAPGTLNAVIQVSDGSNDIFTSIELLKNGVVLTSWSGSETNVSFPVTVSGTNGDYFYARVKQLDQDQAISSPIFIKGAPNLPPVVSVTSPLSGAQYKTGDAITVHATASDPDGTTISKVEFYKGSVYLGTDNTAEYSFTYTESAAGTYILTAKAYDSSGAVTTSAPVTIQVTSTTGPGSVSASITNNNDDAEEYKTGGVYLTQSVLNLVYESKTSGNQTIGLRFNAIAIPQGATITKAVLRLAASGASGGKCALVIRGQAADNAASFTTASKNLSSRVKTLTGVSWSPGAWTSGASYDSPDIKAVIQEIVSRAGWSSGSSLAIMITGTGTRNAKSLEDGSAPQLLVEYTTSKSGTLNTTGQTLPSEEKVPATEMILYPNPVSGLLTIRFQPETRVDQIRIYSMTGSLVKTVKIAQDLQETQLDCSSLKPGTYLLTAESGPLRHTLRFIKQ